MSTEKKADFSGVTAKVDSTEQLVEKADFSGVTARVDSTEELIGERTYTIEKGDTRGLMKVVVDGETHRILGAAILGTGGDEAIHGVIDVMTAGVPYETLKWSVGIHPTVSELIPTVLGEMKPA